MEKKLIEIYFNYHNIFNFLFMHFDVRFQDIKMSISICIQEVEAELKEQKHQLAFKIENLSI